MVINYKYFYRNIKKILSNIIKDSIFGDDEWRIKKFFQFHQEYNKKIMNLNFKCLNALNKFTLGKFNYIQRVYYRSIRGLVKYTLFMI